MRKNPFELLIYILPLIFYLFLILSPVNLSTADLGRHIKNGQELLSGNFDLLFRNYYSYTYPDFPFVNHHWLGGVVFYLVSLLGGITGIHLLFILINLITFSIFFRIALKESNIYISSLLALLLVPVIAYRDEVRPEAFSYLFAGIYYFGLKAYTSGKISGKRLIWLLPVQLIWVNTHIYFFIGLYIIGVFWLTELSSLLINRHKKDLSVLKTLTLLGFGCVLVSLANPFFYNGLIYPFKIFANYGYRVLENQSVFFLERVISVPVIIYFKVALILLLLSWLYKFFRFFKFKEKISRVDLLFSLTFSVLALIQIRNFELFGLFSLVAISGNLSSFRLDYSKYLIIPALGVMLVFMLVLSPGYWEGHRYGLGAAQGIEKAGEFFLKEKIKGPVFNNYDIGGYLIYYLYPEEKVFVDNRPEGYPAEFFTETYVPMQEDNAVWKKEDGKYKFNAIFFYRQDLTPWAQTFLVSRIKDPDWAPVFVDNYNIIFLKRNEVNSAVIKQFELPANMFNINKE